MKKIFSVATITAMVMASASAFAANEGETSSVVFNGSIKENTCVINNGSKGQTVVLGDIEKSVLANQGNYSQPVGFTIALDQCDTANATITFKGETPPSINNALKTTASGVGIQILDQNTPVVVDGSTHAQSINVSSTNPNEFDFTARYIALDNNVAVGLANSTVDFTVKYN
ncbi:fimbrial protein [Enterobacter hormaechei]|uniref:fimbrial protein n=1 Tax=Enterobacter hormaechei TaxID=158836 RepID=UPI003D6E2E78